MSRIRHGLRRSLGVVSGLALVLAVAACDPPPFGAPDIRQRYGIKVEQKTFAMALKLAPDGGPANALDAARMSHFVRDFLRRGDGPLRIATPPGLDKAAARARADAVGVRLMAEGLRLGDIALQEGLAPVSDRYAVVLSFRGSEVKVSECGDWSGGSGFNPSNQPHTDYGCSYQRNLGLMLSDPGDLVRAGELGPLDASRRDRVIQLFRAGEPTGVEVEKKEAESATQEGD